MNEYIDRIRRNSDIAEDFFAKRLAFTLGPVELKAMIADGKVKVVDVRQKEDYDESHIPGAISIPKKELSERLDEIPKNGIYVVCCYNQQCHLAAAAALVLAQEGRSVMELEGGFKTWVDDFGFEVEK